MRLRTPNPQYPTPNRRERSSSSSGVPCSNFDTHGFTLVELLVVMAIISILAGLLLPVLKSALDSARCIACVNNLKQYGAATGFYAGDNSGRIPITGDWDRRNENPREWGLHYGHAGARWRCWTDDLLPPYIGDYALEKCPHHSHILSLYPGFDNWSKAWGARPRSYGYNRHLSAKLPTLDGAARHFNSIWDTNYRSKALGIYGSPGGEWPRLARIKRPSQTVQIGEATQGHSGIGIIGEGPGFSGWHGSRLDTFNRVFLDGHAKTVFRFDPTGTNSETFHWWK